jgi:hypothetical protein
MMVAPADRFLSWRPLRLGARKNGIGGSAKRGSLSPGRCRSSFLATAAAPPRDTPPASSPRTRGSSVGGGCGQRQPERGNPRSRATARSTGGPQRHQPGPPPPIPRAPLLPRDPRERGDPVSWEDSVKGNRSEETRGAEPRRDRPAAPGNTSPRHRRRSHARHPPRLIPADAGIQCRRRGGQGQPVGGNPRSRATARSTGGPRRHQPASPPPRAPLLPRHPRERGDPLSSEGRARATGVRKPAEQSHRAIDRRPPGGTSPGHCRRSHAPHPCRVIPADAGIQCR